jgi:hypothetical protein
MRAERRRMKPQPPTVWRPHGRIAAHSALTALLSSQAKQQSSEHPDGRTRRAVGCMLAGLLIAAPIWAFAYMGEHYEWQPHGVVLLTVGGVMLAGLMWLLDEIFGD